MLAQTNTANRAPSVITVAALDYYEPEVRHRLSAEFAGMDVRFAAGKSEADRMDVAADADVLLAGWSPVSAAVMTASPRIRLIQKMGVGVDRIDLEAAAAHGIRVLRAAGINAGAVAEMTILLMLAVLREFPWAVGQLRAGRFEKEVLRERTIQLAGQRVGLIGFGHIGVAVATLLQAFRTEVAYYDIRTPALPGTSAAAPMALDDLLAWSDIVSLHVPLTEETRSLLDSRRIATMRRGAVVVNTARGGLIDEDALCDAIDRGHLRGAGLDVTAEEPLGPRSRLLSLDRVIVTPHMGGAVASNFANVARRARSNIEAFFTDEPVGADDVVC